jgi:hypothetical protein
MISRKEIKLLRSGQIEYIPLRDGYVLSINEYSQFYLSRQGKKKYFVSDKLVYGFCKSHRDPDFILLFIKIIKKLGTLTKKLKKESATRQSIESLILEINSYI